MSGFQLCVTSHSNFHFKIHKIFFFREEIKNKLTLYRFNPVVVNLGKISIEHNRNCLNNNSKVGPHASIQSFSTNIFCQIRYEQCH